MKKITLLLALVCTMSAFSQRTAKNYLIQLGTSGAATWTKTLGANDSIVDLTVAGQTLTQWLAGRTSWISTGDQIWIAAGNYTFTSYYNIGSSPSLSGSFPSAIYGGFAGNENAVTDRAKGANKWDYTNETILNGASSTNGIFGAGSDRNMVIDGLTFTGCINTAGQAIYQRPNMTIQNCKFTTNACVAVRYYINAASKNATISNCYFYGNTNTVNAGAEGGCLMINNSSAGGTYTATSCLFDSNSCTASGSGASAGIKAQGAGVTNITNCTFKNNNATAGNSSAVSLTSATSSLINTLIYGTSLATNKPAIYVNAGGSVTNCTVVNNLGGGIYVTTGTTATNINLTNTVFWGEDAKSGQISAAAGCLGTINNCAYVSLSSNFSGTATNTVTLTTSSAPEFADAANNNWMPALGSVLIDAGTATGAPAIDIRGYARTGTIDIGAYEYGATAAIHNPSVTKEMAVACVAGKLISKMAGKLSIYSVSGKLMVDKQVLADEEVSLPKGVYVLKMETTEKRINQKIVL